MAGMRYRLRTLLILLTVGPFVAALVYWQVERVLEARRPKPPRAVFTVIWGRPYEDVEVELMTLEPKDEGGRMKAEE